MHDVAVIRRPWEDVQRAADAYGHDHGITVCYPTTRQITLYSTGLRPVADFYRRNDCVLVIYDTEPGGTLLEALGARPRNV